MKCLRKIVRHYWKNWTQPTNPSGITATSGWENPMNAFDNNADTYARCNSTTEYIEYDFGEEIYLTGINSNGIQINGQAVATSLVVNYFDRANVETLLVHTTRSSDYDSYTNNATFNATKTSKVRIYIDTTYSGAPSRTIQITFLGYKEGTLQDYDFYTDEEVSELPKKTVIKYWKYQYNTWLQQTLSSDGTLGEEYFAVSSNYVESGHPAYYMFDNNSSSYYSCYKNDGGNYYTFYNPNPLNVSKIVFNFANDKSYSEFSTTTVQASNNGSSWISLENSWNTDGTLTINNNDYYYRYYRIYQVYWWTAYSCSITATERSVIEGTQQDYDFTTAEYTYYGINQ